MPILRRELSKWVETYNEHTIRPMNARQNHIAGRSNRLYDAPGVRHYGYAPDPELLNGFLEVIEPYGKWIDPDPLNLN